MKLIKAMATVAGFTMISRVLGFIRDTMTAIILGAGPLADAFFVALKLPNLFRRISAEGAFSVAFIPLFSESIEKVGIEESKCMARNMMGFMFMILTVFSVIAMLAMPYVIRGVMMAGIVQFAFIFIYAAKHGWLVVPTWPKLTPKVKRLGLLMMPGIIGAGVYHLNIFADMIIASFLESGSISYLYYADRLQQLPLGVVDCDGFV